MIQNINIHLAPQERTVQMKKKATRRRIEVWDVTIKSPDESSAWSRTFGVEGYTAGEAETAALELARAEKINKPYCSNAAYRGYIYLKA